MEELLYTYGDKTLYVNLTNRCPCSCTFCIRNNGSGVGSAESLWLDHDPGMEEIQAAFAAEDLSQYKEVVFCGYGEPTCALDNMLETCKYIRSVSKIPIRLNTNGLSDLIHKRPTAQLLKGLVDTVSISLNAPNKEEYVAVTRPSFGEAAFDAMLRFAVDCKKEVPHVVFSVVDVLTPEQIEASQALADSLGIPLRVRGYSK